MASLGATASPSGVSSECAAARPGGPSAPAGPHGISTCAGTPPQLHPPGLQVLPGSSHCLPPHSPAIMLTLGAVNCEWASLPDKILMSCRRLHSSTVPEGGATGQLQYEGDVAALALAALVRLTGHAGMWSLQGLASFYRAENGKGDLYTDDWAS